MKIDLPTPSSEALALSEHLKSKLLDQARAGSLSFVDFMRACLYEPGLGYYVAGSRKFGPSGDFITAPGLSPLFGLTLAQATYQTVLECQGAYLELGAGSGALARDLLSWLETQGDHSTVYYILEVSPECRAQQKESLAPYLHRVVWLDALPHEFSGVILANEVLDALAVNLFCYKQGALFERRVSVQDDRFIWVDEPMTEGLLKNAVEDLKLPDSIKQDYLSEINPTLPAFIHSLIDSLKTGQLVLIDYGFLRETYYHPDRKMGTLMCHYRHHAHPDPFLYPGLQDITAHVDFTTVGYAAQEAGLEPVLYTQAEYLLQHGILNLLENVSVEADSITRARLTAAVLKLIQPQEMGELFKVMVISV